MYNSAYRRDLDQKIYFLQRLKRQCSVKDYYVELLKYPPKLAWHKRAISRQMAIDGTPLSR